MSDKEKRTLYLEDVMEKNEKYQRLDDVIHSERVIAAEIKELQARQKDAKEEIMKELRRLDLDRIVGTHGRARRVERKGSIKWDKTWLFRNLTPEQLDKAYSEGQASEFVIVEDIKEE